MKDSWKGKEEEDKAQSAAGFEPDRHSLLLRSALYCCAETTDSKTYNWKILRQSWNEVIEYIVDVEGRRFECVVDVDFDGGGVAVVASQVRQKILQVWIGELTNDALVKVDLKPEKQWFSPKEA